MHLSLSHYLFSPLDETSTLNYLNCTRKISVSARRSYLPEISRSWVESTGQRGSLSSGSSIITVAPVWLHMFRYPTHDPVNPVWVCVSLTVSPFTKTARSSAYISNHHSKSDIWLYMSIFKLEGEPCVNCENQSIPASLLNYQHSQICCPNLPDGSILKDSCGRDNPASYVLHLRPTQTWD